MLKKINFFLIAVLALSATATMKAQDDLHLPTDISFTGTTYAWEGGVAYGTTDPEMWVVCIKNYAPQFMCIRDLTEENKKGQFWITASGNRVCWMFETEGGYRFQYANGQTSPARAWKESCRPNYTPSEGDNKLPIEKVGFPTSPFEDKWKGHSFYEKFPVFGERRKLWFDASYDPRTKVSGFEKGYEPLRKR